MELFEKSPFACIYLSPNEMSQVASELKECYQPEGSSWPVGALEAIAVSGMLRNF